MLCLLRFPGLPLFLTARCLECAPSGTSSRLRELSPDPSTSPASAPGRNAKITVQTQNTTVLVGFLVLPGNIVLGKGGCSSGAPGSERIPGYGDVPARSSSHPYTCLLALPQQWCCLTCLFYEFQGNIEFRCLNPKPLLCLPPWISITVNFL